MAGPRGGAGGAVPWTTPCAVLLALQLCAPVSALPIVDPGLFVILGVRTCGGGGGYCLLGSDCSLDRDFAADETGHCEGLRAAFTPAAHFSCCKYVERSSATLPGEPAEAAVTEDPAASATTDDAENAIEAGGLADPPSVAAGDAVKPETEVKGAGALAVREPEGPAAGQTVVAVSDEYKVKNSVDDEDEAEEAEVVAVASADKEAILEAPACRSLNADVNPCWRNSFLDRHGVALCSGTLVGVDAAVTTAVCASRLMEAGTGGVSLRVDGLSLPVRDLAVHQGYRGVSGDPNDIAVVRLLLAGGPAGTVGPVDSPSASCIACLPPSPGNGTQLAGKTCFALAARLNGMGVETSAVCAGRVEAQGAAHLAAHLRLGGCEVASLKSPLSLGEPQAARAVRAREGAALLCDGLLVALASTETGSFASLGRHLQWLLRALAAPRATASAAFHVV